MRLGIEIVRWMVGYPMEGHINPPDQIARDLGLQGGVVELADTADSKSAAARRRGSTPLTATCE